MKIESLTEDTFEKLSFRYEQTNSGRPRSDELFTIMALPEGECIKFVYDNPEDRRLASGRIATLKRRIEKKNPSSYSIRYYNVASENAIYVKKSKQEEE